MTHTYHLTGMTCGSCEAKVKSALIQVAHVNGVSVSKENSRVEITMDTPVPLKRLQEALDPKYTISAEKYAEPVEETRSWFATYKPILMIAGYLSGVTLLIQAGNDSFNGMQWMRHFMAGFFLVFSFFKLLNLKGFAESYVMYDVIAKQVPAWAYIYAFLELGLGIAYLLHVYPLITNFVTVIVMSLSMIGVLQTVLNKQRIQCACLGAVFNLPMSTVTILEDGVMIGMSAWMLMMV